MALPQQLRSSIETGSVTLFLGAGIGYNVLDENGQPSPDGQGLSNDLSDEFKLGVSSQPLPKASQLVEIRHTRSELESFLRKRLTGLKPDEDLQWLLSRTWRAIYTTNYDDVIEEAYDLQEKPTQQPVVVSSSSDIVDFDLKFQVPIMHLHGSLFRGERPSALITSQDYAHFAEHRQMLFNALKQSFATSPILYIGYSNTDPNWEMVLAELQDEFSPKSPPPAYRVDPNAEEIDIEILRAQGIETIKADLSTFVREMRAEIGDLRVEPHKLSALADSIQPSFRPMVEAAPAMAVRIDASWEDIGSADLSLAPNTRDFYRGNLPNWSLLNKEIQFHRDVEDELLDSILDFCTAPKPVQRSILLTGSAGYGTSTVLMATALRAVQEDAGKIFFHRRGSGFRVSDVVHMADSFDGPKIFVVDNAADVTDELAELMQQLRDRNLWAAVVLGERTNEWRQARVRMRPSEVALGSLSDGEISRLLDALEGANELGYMEALDPKVREGLIRDRLGKQLIVILREVTENSSFAAIIEDEFRSIQDPLGRDIYAAVSSLARFRVAVRASVVGALVEASTAEVLDALGTGLEGVVIDDGEMERTDRVGLRPRHAVIAEMVWERCVGPSERESYVRRAMDAFNLHYRLDVRAFEKLTRSDEAIDSISTVDGRIEFFEKATRKDPSSPYVRQHYARMLRRSKQFEDALQEVEAGIEMGDPPRVLLHTKGSILSDMALAAPSKAVGRRRLNQAEGIFNDAIKLARKDSYAYHGLGLLYFEWAKRSSEPHENIEYLAKAEATIADGLAAASSKSSLTILSSDIAAYLGEDPEAVALLRRAVAESSTGEGTARYLLARALFQRQEYSEAVSAAEPLVFGSEPHPRACIIYARSKFALGATPAECAAALRTSEVAGGRLPIFVAYYGGFLFLADDHLAAERVFKRAASEIFNAQDRNRLLFQPDEDSYIFYRGQVQRVRIGFTFIRLPGSVDLFCPGSKFGDVAMEEGLWVEARVGFSPRGAVAYDVRLPAG